MTKKTFNVTPGPRVLVMLGEINLEPWRCFGEILDNNVDEFLAAARERVPIQHPTINIEIPTQETEDAEIVIRDNGRGMDIDTLEHAVRAGWSGKSPLKGLGLFGMGFNIATARMGTHATVWTTRDGDANWVGLKIDLYELMRRGSYEVDSRTRPKKDPAVQGTEVRIGGIRDEHRKYLRSGAARGALKRELERAYGSMLREDGEPIHVTIKLNANPLKPHRHCIWGGPTGAEDRYVQTRDHGPVSAYQAINLMLPARPFCENCLNWLSLTDDFCLQCKDQGRITKHERRIRGWLGVQRYLHESDYGIDFIRFGRKIEVRNKDLFTWFHEGREEKEYPIDDPRGLGRLVGEIHLDHCRVSFTKDRFERSDPSWTDMVKAVRGDAPLRPNVAKERGLPLPDSPLAKLYAAFRRNQPGGGNSKKPGYWKRILVIQDNEKAIEEAAKFQAGESGHQSDGAAYDLIEEYEKQLLRKPEAVDDTEEPEGFVDESAPQDAEDQAEESGPAPKVAEPPTQRAPLLDGRYECPVTDVKWMVVAYETTSRHSGLSGRAWATKRQPNGDWAFFYDPSKPVFRSVTLTPLDALLAELAHYATDRRRETGLDVPYGQVLEALRSKYAKASELDPTALAHQAREVFDAIGEAVGSTIDDEEAANLFDQLAEKHQASIRKRMAKHQLPNPQVILGTGAFLRYISPEGMRDFFADNPELFFDGRCWDESYAALTELYGRADAEPAREHLVSKYAGLLADLAWLAIGDVTEIKRAGRSEVIRAMQGLEILSPEPVETQPIEVLAGE